MARRGGRADRNRVALDAVQEEGAAAYRSGVPVDGNPYVDGGGNSYSGQWAHWQMGWRKAEWRQERTG